jgi:site-specific recombinase XerD
MVSANPCNRLRIKVPKPLRPSANLSDIPLLLGACDSTRDKRVVAMPSETGLRLTELANVSAGDLNLERSTITVWGKGAKQRVVRYGPMTEELLIKWLNERPNVERLLTMPPRGISSMLYRLQTQTGIKCNAHAFRRTFATESVHNGLNVFYVQSLLEHSSLTMTRIYAEQVSSEDAIKAYRPIVT